ncbi:MAG: non-hydrolyzing UDP-N-acetylglucosamine 2-epimerase [bacterium]
MKSLKIVNVVGARPNFMKVAPIIDGMKKHGVVTPFLLHTGQHYDRVMSELFFDHLGLPKPDIYLGVGSGGHGEQTGKIMIEFEKCMHELQPDMVLVVGDVNSTIACGLVATKLGIKLAHVEAGLRSFDRTMPEEINRVLTDRISDYLFITEESAFGNLQAEGIENEKIHFVGNVMIDSLLKHREKACESRILAKHELQPNAFTLVTLHRPANVDNKDVFEKLFDALCRLSELTTVVFPVHPRTRNRIDEFGLDGNLQNFPALKCIDPVGYLDFLHAMANSRMVITDSGGIQEETTVLGIPCLTTRDNTERPVTVDVGTNIIVGRDPDRIFAEAQKILAGKGKQGRLPELWDGKAAERIVNIIREKEMEL